MNPITDLVDKLEDAAAVEADNYRRALLKHAAITIRQLQGEAAKVQLDAHITFLAKLGDGFHELSRRMQGHG